MTGHVHHRFVHICPTFFRASISHLQSNGRIKLRKPLSMKLARPERVCVAEFVRIQSEMRRAARPGTENPFVKRTIVVMLAVHLCCRSRTQSVNRSTRRRSRSRENQPTPGIPTLERFLMGFLARSCCRALADGSTKPRRLIRIIIVFVLVCVKPFSGGLAESHAGAYARCRSALRVCRS